MIDRYLIRYFLAVVEQGNFSRAAGHCNVSQPTLSVGIAKLEKAVDRRLFVRTNQRVELTEAGTRFLVHARRIEQEFNNALSALGMAPQEESFRLGVLHSISSTPIARAVRQFRISASGKIELTFASERELLGQLTRGRLDAMLTIIRPAIQDFPTQEVLEEGYAMVLADDHPLAHRHSLHAEELASEVMIVRRHCEVLPQTSRYFVERGVRPHFSLRTTNDERATEMVRAGLGITVMPDSHRAMGVRHVRLTGFDHRRTLGFYVADKGRRDHPLLVSIANVLQEGLTEGDDG